jgi:hypothetical protein
METTTLQAKTSYEPRPLKRTRRTDAEQADLRIAICEVLEAEHPITLRALFYRLVSRGALAKIELAYKSLGRYLCRLRNDGVVPWEYVIDNTRKIAVTPTFASTRSALGAIRRIYRRDPWVDQPIVMFVMTEKDAIAGILSQETERYAIPLAVVRGFSSQTFLHLIAERIADCGKPAVILYFGDHDPSGLAVQTSAERLLRRWAPLADITIERLAVTPEQIVTFNLTTRPTKKSDSRSKTFIGDSVEVDALPMAELRRLVREAIERQLDFGIYAETMNAESVERAQLARWIGEQEDDDDDE